MFIGEMCVCQRGVLKSDNDLTPPISCVRGVFIFSKEFSVGAFVPPDAISPTRTIVK